MKYALGILVILLVLTNAFWVYNAVDRGVTLSYARSSQIQQQKTIKTLLLLNNFFSLGEDYGSVAEKLGSNSDIGPTKKRKSAIFVGSVVLIFDNAKLSSVRLLDDLTSQEYEALDK